ncbi:hypothetical protein T261_0852 [Streptomyces lydicus]|nr:hypothetical protein T261_0852 [Streptomyces lydicus]
MPDLAGRCTFTGHLFASGSEHRWTAAHTGPHPWQATFTCGTPRELVVQFMGKLGRLPNGTAAGIDLNDELDERLRAARWTRTAYGTTVLYASPDRLCTLAHTPHDDIGWQFTTTVPGNDTSWNVTFTRDTPPQLAGAVIQRLLWPDPVLRRQREVPLPSRRYARITPITGLPTQRQPPEPPPAPHHRHR